MTKLVETPNVAKSVEEAKSRLKKADLTKIQSNTKSAKSKRGY
ncbi:hypothetical protein [Sessilibacter sp. MAH2]